MMYSCFLVCCCSFFCSFVFHRIDLDNGQIIDRGNYRIRKYLESCHTAITENVHNNSKPLPGQYSILTNKHESMGFVTRVHTFLCYYFYYFIFSYRHIGIIALYFPIRFICYNRI